MQRGYCDGDTCSAAHVDGVICSDEQCDIAVGVRRLPSCVSGCGWWCGFDHDKNCPRSPSYESQQRAGQN